MSQPKNRRRAARRRARVEAEQSQSPSYYVHVLTTGATRNPIGKVSSLDRTICVGFGIAAVYRDGKVFADGGFSWRRRVVTLRRIRWTAPRRGRVAVDGSDPRAPVGCDVGAAAPREVGLR
jgi:hypothetical protein